MKWCQNYVIDVNHLQSIPMYWDCNHFVGSVSIQNVSKRTRYREVLQNLLFNSKEKQDKTDKGYKIRPSSVTWMNNFKQYFWMSMSKVLMNMWQNSKEAILVNEAILENETYKMEIQMVVSMSYFHCLLIQVWFVFWSEERCWS